MTIADFTSATSTPIRVGSAAMIGEEIVVVKTISGDTCTIGRGCCDTVPAEHEGGTAGLAPGDPSWSSVALLCQFNTAGTSIEDNGPVASAPVAITAGASVSNTRSKWGGGALTMSQILANVAPFTGSRFNRANGTAVTYEFWFYNAANPNTAPSGFYIDLFSNGARVFGIAPYANAGNIYYYPSSGPLTDLGNFTQNAWHFCQMVITASNTLEIRIDNTSVYATTSLPNYGVGPWVLFIGGTASPNATAADYSIDDLRITSGVARPWAVPTSEFLRAPYTVQPETIWFFDDYVYTDSVEYGAGESIAVKPLPRTAGGMQVSIESSPPIDHTFAWRFARPYPPANVRVNGATWFTPVVMNDTVNQMAVTWAHRDRVGQQDVLLAHDDASLSAPEPGASYSLDVYTAAGTLVAQLAGITSAGATYTLNQAATDFGVTTGTHTGYMILQSERDAYTSWQNYRIDFSFNAAAVTVPVYRTFDMAYSITTLTPLPQITTLTLYGEFRVGEDFSATFTLGATTNVVSRTTISGDTNMGGVATAFAAQIDALANYTATAAGNVVTVTGPASQAFGVQPNNIIVGLISVLRTQTASPFVSNSVDQQYETSWISAPGYNTADTYQLRIQQTPEFGGAVVCEVTVGPSLITAASIASAIATGVNGNSGANSLGITAAVLGSDSRFVRVTIPAAIGDNFFVYRISTNSNIPFQSVTPTVLAALAGPARPQISTATVPAVADGRTYVITIGSPWAAVAVAGPSDTASTVATALATQIDALADYTASSAGAVITVTHASINVPFSMAGAVIDSTIALNNAETQAAR